MTIFLLLQVRKLIMRKSSNTYSVESYDVEVWTKGILRVSGRRRVDMTVRVMKDGMEDSESLVYKTIVQDMKKYLAEKYFLKSKFLPIPDYIKIGDDSLLEIDGERGGGSLIMIENMKHLGFKKDLMANHDGLDYEHSVLVIAALAKFHATSYCFRNDSKVAILEKYPVLQAGISIPKMSMETVETLHNIFKTHPEFEKYSQLFLGPEKEELKTTNSDLLYFGVLCHGNFCRENCLFKYKSNMESIISCCDVVFQDLSRCHYGSCVLDLLQFIFTSVGFAVRHNFMADLVCSVYYDNFAKTVSSINSNIAMFSKKDFIKEFDKKIIYGFLFSLNIDTIFYEEDQDISDDEAAATYEKHEKDVLALVTDILRFKMKTEATMM